MTGVEALPKRVLPAEESAPAAGVQTIYDARADHSRETPRDGFSGHLNELEQRELGSDRPNGNLCLPPSHGSNSARPGSRQQFLSADANEKALHNAAGHPLQTTTKAAMRKAAVAIESALVPVPERQRPVRQAVLPSEQPFDYSMVPAEAQPAHGTHTPDPPASLGRSLQRRSRLKCNTSETRTLSPQSLAAVIPQRSSIEPISSPAQNFYGPSNGARRFPPAAQSSTREDLGGGSTGSGETGLKHDRLTDAATACNLKDIAGAGIKVFGAQLTRHLPPAKMLKTEAHTILASFSLREQADNFSASPQPVHPRSSPESATRLGDWPVGASSGPARSSGTIAMPAKPAAAPGPTRPGSLVASADREKGQVIPNSPGPPAMQIAEPLLAFDVIDGETAIPQRQPNLVSVAALTDPPVQILRLQLEPENLGMVTVRMRLAGPQLELRVEAEEPETARLIAIDKELLAAKLRLEGYGIEAVVVVSPAPLAPPPGPNGNAATSEHFPDRNNGGANAHGWSSMADDKPAPRSKQADGDGKDSAGVRLAAGELIL